VSVDDTLRFQALVGIGAGMGYVVDEIVQHSRQAELFDAMFAASGFTMLRMRNRYGQEGDEDLESTREITTAATERLDEPPTIILNSASPPGSLKQNESNWCEGDPETCTLARLPDGAFDYAGLATHWRASLDAYAAVGVAPDYISIQNNPDWVPPAGNANEACRFLPTQGTVIVTTDTGDVEVEYPGYTEALEAVLGELEGLASVPKIIAPETTGSAEVAEYVAELDMANVDAIAHHLYTDAPNPDPEALAALGDLGQQHERPLFQSEMHADSLTTAVLMHASLTVEGAAVYIHNGFVASASDIQPDGLINLTADDFAIGDTYHVVRHYSGQVRPGWIRVAADPDTDSLLASAWVSPDDDALVVVLTNPASTKMAVQIETGVVAPASTVVTRTVLGGLERSAELGELPSERIVTLPGQSIVTVAIQK
jgi:glucuronoarabinoxylan endo-1,4-beta-xylanase